MTSILSEKAILSRDQFNRKEQVNQDSGKQMLMARVSQVHRDQ